MSRIIPAIIIACFAFATTTIADEPWHTEVQKALKLAKSQQRPMVITVETDGCMFCETMRGTWKDSAIDSAVRQNFVALRLDTEKNATIIEKMKIKRFPATIVYATSGKLVAKKEGLMFAGECQSWLADVKEKLNLGGESLAKRD